jgi:preprotein translocase subunit SecA
VEKQAPGLMKEAERFLILSNIDRLWKEHLQALKFVQQAVGLRGYAQRDPLIEYKLEGYNLFLDMMAQIRRNVIYSVYQVSLNFVGLVSACIACAVLLVVGPWLLLSPSPSLYSGVVLFVLFF